MEGAMSGGNMSSCLDYTGVLSALLLFLDGFWWTLLVQWIASDVTWCCFPGDFRILYLFYVVVDYSALCHSKDLLWSFQFGQ